MKNIFKRADGLKVDDERIGPLLGRALGSLPESGECPTPEDLAALSENKIGGNERERLLLHLAGCGRCRTAYSMVCEIASGAESAAGTDYRWQARRLVPLAAAAGLILVIVSWPLLEHRKSIVTETASPYIQKPVASEPEKTTTAIPAAVDAHQGRHPKISEATPEPETPVSAKEKMERVPAPMAQAAPRKGMQPVLPLAPMPAKEIEDADTASKAMESPKMTASPLTEAPNPAVKAEAGSATPAEDSSLTLFRQAPEAPRPAYELEPRFIASPITKPAESPPEPVNLHQRVEIDKEQRLSLSKADAATYDKVKIEEIFKDLKLDRWGFPLQDINKVVIQWTGPPRRRGQSGVAKSGEGAASIQPGEQGKVHATISLEDDGVLTIDIQGTPSRRGKVAVGC